MLRYITIITICAAMIAFYHYLIPKNQYVNKSEIYVVNTTQILTDMAKLFREGQISEDEFRSRAKELQKRLSEHPGLVFELGAMPGKIDNDIQSEFQDLLRK